MTSAELSREVEGVAALVDSIGGEVFLLGHSFGGLLALEAAARTRVAKLLVYEPYAPAAPAPEPSAVTQSFAAMLADPEALLVRFLRDIVQMSDADVARLRVAGSRRRRRDDPARDGRRRAASDDVRGARRTTHPGAVPPRRAEPRVPPRGDRAIPRRVAPPSARAARFAERAGPLASAARDTAPSFRQSSSSSPKRTTTRKTSASNGSARTFSSRSAATVLSAAG